MKIDISNHIVPPNLLKAAAKLPPGRYDLAHQPPVLIDVEARLRVLEEYPDVVQILTVTSGGNDMETAGPPDVAYELARIANDGMAEMVAKYPDKLIAFLAIVPLTDVDRALKEIERAVGELGAKGIHITANSRRPLDRPEFMAVYERMAHYDLPIFIHPQGESTQPDYDGESESKYLISGLWGWPYQTTLAMTRLVFSGVFDRFPNIKFVTHHAGAMVPFNEFRMHNRYDPAVQRGESFLAHLKKHPVDYFRMFYNDSANAGATAGLMCAYDFFNVEHLLFGSDCPWGMPPGYGSHLYRDTIKYIEAMDISSEDREKIFAGNARKLYHLD